MNKSKYLLSFILIIITPVIYAQKGVPIPGTNDSPPPPGLFIDGGLFYLFIIGIVYGMYELKSKK